MKKTIFRGLLAVLFCAVALLVTAGGTTCAATKKDGTPCKGYAQEGSKYCYFHNPATQCEGKNSKGQRCGCRAEKGSKFCHWHQPAK